MSKQASVQVIMHTCVGKRKKCNQVDLTISSFFPGKKMENVTGFQPSLYQKGVPEELKQYNFQLSSIP